MLILPTKPNANKHCGLLVFIVGISQNCDKFDLVYLVYWKLKYIVYIENVHLVSFRGRLYR